MALTHCKECRAEMSTSAAACPKCGAKPPKRTSVLTWVVAVVLGGAVLSAVMEGAGGKRPAAPEPQLTEAQRRDKAQEDARWNLTRGTIKAVQPALREPESLQIEKVLVNQDGTKLCAVYRAKNGFGGMTREAVFATPKEVRPIKLDELKQRCAGLAVDMTDAAN